MKKVSFAVIIIFFFVLLGLIADYFIVEKTSDTNQRETKKVYAGCLSENEYAEININQKRGEIYTGKIDVSIKSRERSDKIIRSFEIENVYYSYHP